MEFSLDGPVGSLEARLELPAGGWEGAPRAVAAVCHPHPLYAGTMRNTVVFRTTRALTHAGIAALRFNFRGVEASEGEHDGQGGEEGDLAAALDWLGAEYPGLPLWAAGFSFGARTAYGLALREERIERLVLVALPVNRFRCPDVEEVRQPTVFVCGSEDEFGTLDDLRRRIPDPPPNFEFHEVEGADHLFRKRSAQLEERVFTWANAALEPRR